MDSVLKCVEMSLDVKIKSKLVELCINLHKTDVVFRIILLEIV